MLQDLEDAKKKKPQEKGNATSDNLPGGRSTVEENLPGVKDRLQFEFLDAAGNPVSTPTIGSVQYEVNTDPFSTMFSAIATSSDPLTDFAVDFVLPPGELLIRAIPFDLAGNAFDFPDLGDPAVNLAIGYVENIPMPEPGSAALAGLAMAVTAALGRRNRRQQNRPEL